MAGVKKVVCPHCKKETLQRAKMHFKTPSPPVGEGGGEGKWNPFWPFCSERCKLIDLGKWASEQYSIPGELVSKEENDDDEEKK